MSQRLHPIQYIGRRYETDDWPEHIYWAEVLEIDGNDMLVYVKAENDGWQETWNFSHFEQGLKMGFYRQYKSLLG